MPEPPPGTAPRATYRLQLGPGLDFAAAAGLVDYLADLGVSHLYLSPIMTARARSTHGYDVADPRTVAAALGGEEGLRALAQRAATRGLGLVVDLVPNHAGIGPDNPLWEELLATGRAGGAARFFDVDWSPPLPGAGDRVILPVLGRPYGEALHAGELEIPEDGRVRYFEHSFPLAPESRDAVARSGGGASLRGRPGEPETWKRLHALLEAQHYRLIWWRAGGTLVNYRRFFTINELAGLRVEDEQVFEATHERILALVADGVVQGLRIDHPDGLRDPARYLARLAERTGGAWTVVEKILEPGEHLPDWPCAGTTGYEFGNDVLGLYVDPGARPLLDALDHEFGGGDASYAASVAAAKGEILRGELAADADRLTRLLWALAQEHPEVRDVEERWCREALVRTLQALDVYRTYVDPETGAPRPEDIERIDAAVERAVDVLADGTLATAPELIYRFLGDVLTGRAGRTPAHLEVIARFQQLSGAVMAKGMEDTALYRSRRLLAVNEVGGDPERLGVTVEAFHRANAERFARYPTGMLTTTTHDTKRGEDVRLRIAALSELGERWAAAARSWRHENAAAIAGTRSGPSPDPQTELLLYQTLVAVWPLEADHASDELRERVTEYAVKASREAKQRTDWADPDEEFEAGLASFIATILDPVRSSGFLASLTALAREAAEIAMVSGLGQTLLRNTAPGVPDCYQGMELWGDNLVDPDNRRPVDFAHRREALASLGELAAVDAGELFVHRRDGRVKLWLLARSLQARAERPALFGAEGAYAPLAVEGRWAGQVVAFARTHPEEGAVITVVPRLPGAVMAAAGGQPLGEAWADTAVVPPADLPGPWVDLLTGHRHDAGTRLHLAEVLRILPVALLTLR